MAGCDTAWLWTRVSVVTLLELRCSDQCPTRGPNVEKCSFPTHISCRLKCNHDCVLTVRVGWVSSGKGKTHKTYLHTHINTCSNGASCFYYNLNSQSLHWDVHPHLESNHPSTDQWPGPGFLPTKAKDVTCFSQNNTHVSILIVSKEREHWTLISFLHSNLTKHNYFYNTDDGSAPITTYSCKYWGGLF